MDMLPKIYINFATLFLFLCINSVFSSENSLKKQNDTITICQGKNESYHYLYFQKNTSINFPTTNNQKKYKEFFPTISISQEEHKTLGNEKIKLIESITTIPSQCHETLPLSKQQLLSLTEITFLEKLRTYSYVSTDGFNGLNDYRIKFLYKKPLTPYNVIKKSAHKLQKLLPTIILSCIYNHYVVKYGIYNTIENSNALAENEKITKINQAIDYTNNLKIFNNELLEKIPLVEVPHHVEYPGAICLHKLFSIIITPIIYKYLLPKFLSTPFPKKKKTHYYWGRKKWRDSPNLSSSFYLNKWIISIIAIAGDVIPYIIHYLELPPVIYPLYIMSIMLITTITGIYNKFSMINKKVIDFPREDFKNLSVKQIIERYLNKDGKSKIIL